MALYWQFCSALFLWPHQTLCFNILLYNIKLELLCLRQVFWGTDDLGVKSLLEKLLVLWIDSRASQLGESIMESWDPSPRGRWQSRDKPESEPAWQKLGRVAFSSYNFLRMEEVSRPGACSQALWFPVKRQRRE